MKRKTVGIIFSSLLAIAPLAPASAHGHGGRNFGFFALGAAVVAGTAAIISAPFNAVAAVATPYPEPYYQPPQQAYYPPPVAYAPPPVYYAQAPAYYAEPVYYAPRHRYYRNYY